MTLAEIRAAVLERDGYQCARCGRPCVYDHSIHHRILGNRKDMRASNLVTLCGSGTTGCHGWVHAHPTLAQDDGYIVSKFHKAQDTPDIPVVYGAANGRIAGWYALADNMTVQAWGESFKLEAEEGSRAARNT